MPDAVLDGVGVRVGLSAVRSAFPAPSGLVEYRLRGAEPGERTLNVSAGTVYWRSPFLDVDARYGSDDGRYAIAGGFTARPKLTYADKSGGEENFLGFVSAWRPNAQVRVRGLAGYANVEYNSGYYGFFAGPNAMPPIFPVAPLLPPTRAHSRDRGVNLGVLLDARPAPGWQTDAALIFSRNESNADYTALQVVATPLLRVTFYQSPQQSTEGLSFNGRVARSFDTRSINHLLSASFRQRRITTQSGDTTTTDLGFIDRRNPAYPALPEFDDSGVRALDEVDHGTSSFEYSGVLWNRLELRAGIDHTNYQKHFRALSGDVASLEQTAWLEHGSMLFSLNERFALFGSFVRGLEDSGIAPRYAVNADEVLPPVEARQIEAGVRASLTPRLTLIVAGFDVEKPFAGLRSDGVYTFVGDVVHRGLELSLNGRVGEDTSILLGVLAMAPVVSGPKVQSGVVGETPPGVSPVIVVGSVTYQLPFARDWSVDAQARWYGPRFVDAANTVEAPSWGTLDIGARYAMNVLGRPSSLRLAISNVLDAQGWSVGRSGAMLTIDRATFRASLTMNLGAR